MIQGRAYVATRGCASCPFLTGPCHEARQHAMDRALELGRHYDCQFYSALRSAVTVASRRPLVVDLLRAALRLIRR